MGVVFIRSFTVSRNSLLPRNFISRLIELLSSPTLTDRRFDSINARLDEDRQLPRQTMQRHYFEVVMGDSLETTIIFGTTNSHCSFKWTVIEHSMLNKFRYFPLIYNCRLCQMESTSVRFGDWNRFCRLYFEGRASWRHFPDTHQCVRDIIIFID